MIGGIKEPKRGANCYVLGTALAFIVGRYKGKKTQALDSYVGKKSLGGMQLQRFADNNSWTEADGTEFPAPGDFFALLTPKLSNTKDNRNNQTEYSHVGALLEYKSNRTVWIAADFGQVRKPGGLGVRRERDYNAGKNTLTSPGSGYGPRVLAGWVNIDKHFG